jgi:hypothetical protein
VEDRVGVRRSALLFCRVTDTPARRIVSSRVIRSGTTVPDDDWAGSSMNERIAAVWELTRQCLAWDRDPNDEPRLQRSIVRIQRAWR